MNRPVYKGGGLRIKEAVFVRNATTNVCMIMHNLKKEKVRYLYKDIQKVICIISRHGTTSTLDKKVYYFLKSLQR